jgi:dTDP-4-amino-4,6-dideoxygalactose transaminase
LRVHGSTRKYHHDEVGVNSRLDELQAAILRVKLGWLETWTERRRAIAARYASALAELPALTVPRTPPDVRHVYHQFTVRVESRRDRLAAALHQRGVQTAIYYPVPLHLQRVHASLGLREGDFPHSEAVAGEVLSLPIFPELREHEIESVVEGVASEVAADLCAS